MTVASPGHVARTAPAPAAYFADVASRWERAAVAAGGAISRDFRVGGLHLRMRFAGPALVQRLAPAIAHLTIDGAGTPDLLLDAWDSATTGVGMADPPWIESELRVNGEIGSFIDQGWYAHYNVWHSALTLLDGSRRRAIYWIGVADDVPDHETASPLFTLFHNWLNPNGLALVHCAAVGLPHGAALLVGVNGAGKSNTSLACLDSPLRHLGDDRALVGAVPEPTVFSLYSTAKSTPADIEHHPHLARLRERVGYLQNGKALYFLNDLFPGKPLERAPLRALLMPRVVGGVETTLAPANPAEGLRILAAETSLRWPRSGRHTLAILSRLFREVPCYTLRLGTDRRRIPPVIQDLLMRG